MNNDTIFKTTKILGIIAFFIISAILLLIFLDAIKFLLIAALASILMIGIQALYKKFAPINIQDKLNSTFSFLNTNIDPNDKSLKNMILKKVQTARNHEIFSRIDEFISSISEIIFNFLSSIVLKLSKQSIDFTKDEDNFTAKGFLSKKILLKKCVYLFLVFSSIIVILRALFNIFRVASFAFVFTIKALCVLLPIIGLILFIGGIFYTFNKEKHDLIRNINNYLFNSDKQTNLKHLAQNIAQELNKLSKVDNLNKEQIKNHLQSAQENLNKTSDTQKNETLKTTIITDLEKNLFIGDEELNIEKFSKFNNYELKQIKKFIEKAKESIQINTLNESIGGNLGVINDNDLNLNEENQTTQPQQENNPKLEKILEAIIAKLTPENENKTSKEISNIYYLVLGEAYKVKNYVKDKL